MQHEIETLCRYRLERAKEDLQAAHVNHESGLFKAAINRSYYAIFHSIRAVNILDGFDASKHSSVIAHFNQYYVHTGEFDGRSHRTVLWKPVLIIPLMVLTKTCFELVGSVLPDLGRKAS